MDGFLCMINRSISQKSLYLRKCLTSILPIMLRTLLTALLLTATFAAMANTNRLQGSWHGTLKVNPQVHLKLAIDIDIDIDINTDSDGNPTATLDSPDQGAYGIEAKVNHLSADSVNITIKKLSVNLAGRLEGDSIVAKFRQGFMVTNLTLYPGPWVQNRPQTPKPPFPYSTEEIRFVNRNDGAVLAGTLTIPDGYTSRTPAVVLLSGSGLQNRDEELFGHKPFAVIADYLARNGIASLRYDDRGAGESTGDPTHSTTVDFYNDAAEAVDYLRSRTFGDIGIIGHSEGASIAFMLASLQEKVPAFIVALGAPSVRGDSILADQSAYMLSQSHIPEEIISSYSDALLKLYDLLDVQNRSANEATVDSLCASWPTDNVYQSLKSNLKQIAASSNDWLRYFVKNSPAEHIANTKCRAFVLYGEKDIQVSPALNMSKMKTLRPDAEIKSYPGLNHMFQHAATGAIQEYGTIEETISPEVLADIVRFIKMARQ